MATVKQAAAFVLISNCSLCDIAPVIEDTVEEADRATQNFLERIDAGIATIQGQSSSWQSVVEDIANDIPDEIQSTIRTEIQSVATRTIAHAGIEARCEIDFLARRATQALQRIRDLVLGQSPDPFEPFICQVVPEILDMNLEPTRRTHISMYGFDLDELTDEGEGLSMWVDIAPGHETTTVPGIGGGPSLTLHHEALESVVASSSLSQSTHYTAILNTASSNGYEPSAHVERLDIMWGGAVIGQIPVIGEIIEEPEPEPEPELVGAFVRIDGSVYIVDDESWSADETGRFPFVTTTTVGLAAAGLPASEWVDPNTPSLCVDEVRATLDIEVSYDPAGEQVLVSMPVELFEGSSCATTDLDGVGNLVMSVPVGEVRTQSITVTNTGDNDGGDTVTVTATVEVTGVFE